MISRASSIAPLSSLVTLFASGVSFTTKSTASRFSSIFSILSKRLSNCCLFSVNSATSSSVKLPILSSDNNLSIISIVSLISSLFSVVTSSKTGISSTIWSITSVIFSQFAIKRLFSMLPVSIATSFTGVVCPSVPIPKPSSHVQPTKIYPSLVGSRSVIVLVSLSNTTGLPSAFVPPFNT